MAITLFDCLPSTNVYAKENLKNLNHKDIVLARTQSAGKGRKNRVWLSQEGGLYFSIIIKPQRGKTDFLPLLTQAMALSVCRAAQNLKTEAYLKWPNDVLSGGRKFCGISSEAVFESGALLGVVLGVGVNINQSQINADKPATTLKQMGADTNPRDLLENILKIFDGYYAALQAQGFSALRGEYKANFPYLGKEVALQTERGPLAGVARDIDGQGRLIVQTAAGQEALTAGDMDF
jgi:BirA family biotin operon repressor/biotin-[acetyl-CoA-carboxylase] ligase